MTHCLLEVSRYVYVIYYFKYAQNSTNRPVTSIERIFLCIKRSVDKESMVHLVWILEAKATLHKLNTGIV